jgi:N-acetylneuraminic acid mutarotase
VGQALAYDSNRKLVMVFGGAAALSGDTPTVRQDVWEWNPATGAWRDRSPTGVMPDARSEAAVVYDSVRDKLILFGGRALGIG